MTGGRLVLSLLLAHPRSGLLAAHLLLLLSTHLPWLLGLLTTHLLAALATHLGLLSLLPWLLLLSTHLLVTLATHLGLLSLLSWLLLLSTHLLVTLTTHLGLLGLLATHLLWRLSLTLMTGVLVLAVLFVLFSLPWLSLVLTHRIYLVWP